MKKFFWILVFVLLNGCDNYNKKYPTKLFGIEIFDNVNSYKISDQDLTIKDGTKRKNINTWYISNRKISFNEKALILKII